MDTRKVVSLFLTFSLAGISRLSAETPDISISNQNVSWDNAVASGYPLLSWEFISQYGWDIVLPYLPIDERLWIGARANKTPYVEWKGCVEWAEDNVSSSIKTEGGSLADCIHHCPTETNYYLLKGLLCFCCNNDSNFRRTQGTCTTSCALNPGDICGGQNDTLSAYFKGPFGYGNDMQNKSADNNDCVLIKHSNRTINNSENQLAEKCEALYIRRYVCEVKQNVSPINTSAVITWQEAFEMCQNNHGRTSNERFENSVAWTTIKRSTHILWGQGHSEAQYCTSMSKTKYNKLTIHSEYCDTKHRYLFVIHGRTEDLSQWKVWIIMSVGATVLVILILTAAWLIMVKRKARRRRQSETLQKNPVNNIETAGIGTTRNNVAVINRGYEFATAQTDDVISGTVFAVSFSSEEFTDDFHFHENPKPNHFCANDNSVRKETSYVNTEPSSSKGASTRARRDDCYELADF